MAATPDGKELFAVGSDKKLKQFEDSSGAGTQMVKEIDTKVLVTQISLPNGGSPHVLFIQSLVGSGSIHTYWTLAIKKVLSQLPVAKAMRNANKNGSSGAQDPQDRKFQGPPDSFHVCLSAGEEHPDLSLLWQPSRATHCAVSVVGSLGCASSPLVDLKPGPAANMLWIVFLGTACWDWDELG